MFGIVGRIPRRFNVSVVGTRTHGVMVHGMKLHSVLGEGVLAVNNGRPVAVNKQVIRVQGLIQIGYAERTVVNLEMSGRVVRRDQTLVKGAVCRCLVIV